MNVFDSVIVPVMITDKDGNIQYKNDAAGYCIPSPRTGGNLRKCIKNILVSDISPDGARILSVENKRSIFRRAVILPRDKTDIWLFFAELQLSEPEEIVLISKAFLRAFTESVASIFDGLENADESMSQRRYYRMEEELLKALRTINFEKNTRPFSVTDILSSLSEATSKLSNALNFRVRFDFDIRDSQMGYRIKFAPFAMVYTYILIFLLHESVNCECYVNAVREKDVIRFTFGTTVNTQADITAGSRDFTQLSSLFSRDRFNLMLIAQRAALHNFKPLWFLTDKGELTLSLTVPLNNTKGMFLFQPIAATVVQREFDRKNKRVLEFLESVFMQYQKN